MKIAAILDTAIGAGGGFNQSLNAILQMQRLCEGRIEFCVYTTVAANVDQCARLGFDVKLYRANLIDLWLAYSSTNELLRRIQNRLRLVGRLEARLLADQVDVAYFVAPSLRCLSLQRLNYIYTVWDLCHRDTPEFPEVRSFNTFLSREHNYRNVLGQALFTLCDSEALVVRLSSRYGVDRERLVAMPFAPAPFLDAPLQADKGEVLAKYGLVEGYFLYPAQFWPHKNHVRIIQAMRLLADDGPIRPAVFCGGDYGNKAYIESVARDLRLSDQVRFLGFVPAEDMRALYEGAVALIVPSYFGPTNLPPLEAWLLRVPLIYSALFSEQAGDAALLPDPDSAEELADAMRKVQQPDVADELVRKGTLRLAAIDAARQAAEGQVAERLRVFQRRRECWGDTRSLG